MRTDATRDDSDTGAGRYNGQSAPELATAAEESLVGIVHLLESAPPAAHPEELFRTLSGLTRMIERVPECVSRISARMSSWSSDDDVVVTSGRFHGDGQAAIQALTDAINDRVLPAAATLLAGMMTAQAAISHVTTITTK